MAEKTTYLEKKEAQLASQRMDVRVSTLLQFIYSKLPKKSGTLLDVGAGNGLALRFFKQKGFKAEGMELSQKLCEIMRSRPELKGVKITQGDITKKSGDETFDYVLASDVIEHIKDDKKALKNLYSYVKPGGMLLISVPAHPALYSQRDALIGHVRRYTKKELTQKTNALKGEKVFITYWNLPGLFVYALVSKVMKRSLPEGSRHKNSSSPLLSVAAFALKMEERLGWTPFGLTLICGIKKPV